MFHSMQNFLKLFSNWSELGTCNTYSFTLIMANASFSENVLRHVHLPSLRKYVSIAARQLRLVTGIITASNFEGVNLF